MCLIKGPTKPEKKDLPLDMVLSYISGWNRSPEGTDLQMEQNSCLVTPGRAVSSKESSSSVLWHPLSTLVPAGRDGIRPRG